MAHAPREAVWTARELPSSTIKKEPEMPGRDRKRWTVLIYMVADDPQGGELLDQQAVQEMDQITAATLSLPAKNRENLYVAVQVDFRTLPGVWRRSIGESTFIRPESNAADPATLYGFFDWATAKCPADHYLLIFWGHSRGQFGMFGDSDPFDYTAQTLTLEELRSALTAAKRSLQKPIDVIAFKDCFMANLETAYELSGLADYLLASPGLVPVEGWPYREMFEALTDDSALKAARRVLGALGDYYNVPKNRGPHEEVAYSLLRTAGAVRVVEALKSFLDEKSSSDETPEDLLRSKLSAAARAPGDPALADLGQLAAASAPAVDGRSGPPDELTGKLDPFIKALGNARPKKNNDDPPESFNLKESSPDSQELVIKHTGKDFGGVSVFVFPESTRDQRGSMLTRLADEKAYKRLAISKDTKSAEKALGWADIALGRMPVKQFSPAQDVSKAIAVLEQLERLGVGSDPRSTARANAYLRRRARVSRNVDPTDADFAEAAQYAAIADLAVRLADFAAAKGGADFAKGGDDFAKGGDDFAKGGDDFAKGGDDFGPR